MYEPSKPPELSPQPVERELVIEPWRKALLDAAERIRQRGWCQGAACDHAGRVCLIGAIFDVRTPSLTVEWSAFAGSPKEKAADFMILNGMHGKWNDRPERTKEEVIAALTECAGQP